MIGMLDYIHQQIEAYRAPEAPRCANQTKTDLCDSFFFGFLQKAFAKLKVKASEPNNRQTSISIEELKSQVLDDLKSPETIIFQTTGLPICSCGSTSVPQTFPFISQTNHINHINSNNCRQCGRVKAQINHATTCSPVPEMQRQIEAKFTNIQGLEWSQYVPNAKATASNTVPEGKASWDYLDRN